MSFKFSIVFQFDNLMFVINWPILNLKVVFSISTALSLCFLWLVIMYSG